MQSGAAIQVKLQRSRAQVSAEIRSVIVCAETAAAGFNGAALK